jgi:phytol kinase
MRGSLLGLFAIWAAFALLVGALARCRRTRRTHPEVLRKVLHAGMGLACLTLPYFFDTVWPVLGLALGFALVLATRAWLGPVRRLLRPILDEVGRPTVGELLFPVAVAVTFAAAGSDWIAFTIAILILALADSVAALVGRRFGRIRYGGPDGKSLEGSAAFCVTALGCTAIPLSLSSDLGAFSTALISLSVSLLVTLAEGLSRRGLDNLLVPVTALWLLRTLPALPLWQHSLALAGVGGLTLSLVWVAVRGARQWGRRRPMGRREPCRT